MVSVRGFLVASLVLLVASAPVALGQAELPWTHMAGDAERSATGPLAPGPSDLLRRIELTNASMAGWDLYGEGFYETSRGVAVLGAAQDGGCVLFFVPDLSGDDVERFDVPSCQAGTLGTMDPSRDVLTICSAATDPGEPLLIALSIRTLELVWSVTLTDLLGADDAPVDPGQHRCEGITHRASDDVLLTVILYAGGGANGGMAALDASSGESVWYRQFPAYPFAQGDRGATRSAGGSAGFLPYFHAHSEVGIVVTGLAAHPSAQTPSIGGPIDDAQVEGAALWLTHDGEFRGAVRAGQLHDVQAQMAGDYPTWASAWPTAEGAAGAFHLGGKLVVVDPRQPRPLQVVDHRAPDGGPNALLTASFSGAAWHQDTLLVPMQRTVTRYDSDALEAPLWSWHTPVDEAIIGLLVAPPSDVLVLSTCTVSDCRSDWIHRLDLGTGRELQRLDLRSSRAPVEGVGSREAALLPLGDGRLLVASDPGYLWVLGPAPDEQVPGASLSTAYPLPNQPIELTPQAPSTGDPVRYDVFWGDGASTTIEPGESATHRFAQRRLHTVRVTAVFEDNTTATSASTVRVGEAPPPPPPDLNAFQEAFAKENQDLTFGVLGVVLALAGGAFGVVRTRRKRGRLARELDAIEAAYAQAGSDPVEQEAALAERRDRVRQLMLDGKLDEGQASVCEQRIDELSRETRIGLLDERFQFLPHGMVLTIRGMLEDAHVNAWEREQIHQALEAEDALTAEQKAEVREVLDAWFERDRARTTG